MNFNRIVIASTSLHAVGFDFYPEPNASGLEAGRQNIYPLITDNLYGFVGHVK
jgi:hypothetical protein